MNRMMEPKRMFRLFCCPQKELYIGNIPYMKILLIPNSYAISTLLNFEHKNAFCLRLGEDMVVK